MTWVIGASSIFGYGVLISDICVTFSDGRKADILQKAYLLGNFIAAGFAGSVQVGFMLLQNLSNFLQMPPDKRENYAWDPCWVARNWSSHARATFESASVSEQKLGSGILIVGIHPTEDIGIPGFARVYVIRLSSPNFSPQIMRKNLSVCSIGSGSGVQEYKRALRLLFDIRSNVLKAEVGNPSGWAQVLLHSISTVITDHPASGISRHLNLFILRRGQGIETNNDEKIYPPNSPPIEIKMPQIARGYPEFLEFAKNVGAPPSEAIC